MQIKKIIKDYFSFGKRDRIGVISLVALIAIIYFLPLLSKRKNDPAALKETAILIKAIDTLKSKEEKNVYKNYADKNDEENNDSYQYDPTQTKNFTDGELFQFDPNTISVEGWQKLGLSEKTSKTIEKYRSKGGKFYKPEDIKKIWGMPQGFYERVKDYITLA